jgi:hypothetical protein
VASDDHSRLVGVVAQLHLLSELWHVLVEESLRERHLTGGLTGGVWGYDINIV